jgi:hypothetical protein
MGYDSRKQSSGATFRGNSKAERSFPVHLTFNLIIFSACQEKFKALRRELTEAVSTANDDYKCVSNERDAMRSSAGHILRS